MHQNIESFLAKITALHQLEPKNLPQDVIAIIIKMSPEELFKTCTQLAVLRHNIPSKDKPITLQEEEIARLAERYLKELIAYLKRNA